jgi:hypothetical protein
VDDAFHLVGGFLMQVNGELETVTDEDDGRESYERETL